MKKIITPALLLIGICLSFGTAAQQNPLLQEMTRLSDTEFNTIGNAQTTRIKREAATRMPGQHNVIILSGDNAINKQNTAQWLAQKTGVSIFRIRLSEVVSPDISITKRNLRLVFEAAANKDWVLFFDEGDALFGRRGTVANGHDRYDTEGTNYFAEQVERYRGSIIISVTASNNINPFIFEKYVRFRIH